MISEKKPLYKTLSEYQARFWILNLMQMFERFAFWIALLQLPIYIAQKDALNGLHWGQEVKGMVFFIWALVQNLFPVFFGGFADNYGYKKSFFVSFIIIILGYVLISTQHSYYPFLTGVIILGLGSAIFKPTVQGAISQSLESNNQSVGWGLNVMLVNLAVFFVAPIAIFLKAMSWQAVFLGSAVIFSINFIFLIFFHNLNYKSVNIEIKQIESPFLIFKKILKNLIKPQIIYFILLMSGFTMLYMQFYETLPNYIVDWIDTSKIIKQLNLPAFITHSTNRGLMISYEWLYNINAGIIIIGVVFISKLFSRINILRVIIFGILIITTGLSLCFVSTNGYWIILGFLIYTFGEMLTNPRFNEFMSRLAPKNDKALFMSYLNISWAIGLGGGSLIGSYLYKNISEKSILANRYLIEHQLITNNLDLNTSFNILLNKTGLNATQATELLWNNYSPYNFWYLFGIIGIISITGLYFYKNKYYNK